MSDIDMEALEDAERAMTAGPWVQGVVSGQCHRKHRHRRCPTDPCAYEYTIDTGSQWARSHVAIVPNITLIGTDDNGPILSERDAAGIVAMRNAFPALLAEVRALRASFASQAQVTVTARQAVSDVVVQRDAALALVAKLRGALSVAAEDADYCYACGCHPSRGHGADCPVVP